MLVNEFLGPHGRPASTDPVTLPGTTLQAAQARADASLERTFLRQEHWFGLSTVRNRGSALCDELPVILDVQARRSNSIVESTDTTLLDPQNVDILQDSNEEANEALDLKEELGDAEEGAPDPVI